MNRLYRPQEQTILVVGEAGFSYARALATLPSSRINGVRGLVATTLQPSIHHAESALLTRSKALLRLPTSSSLRVVLLTAP